MPRPASPIGTDLTTENLNTALPACTTPVQSGRTISSRRAARNAGLTTASNND
jgi:hypothetical protein